jgi:hypothetical protein
MQPILRDMLTWAVGFVVVSTLYLIAGFWLLRRFRKGKQDKATASAATASPPAPSSADEGAGS